MSRVLLADDNLTVQRMVASVLRGEGMSVTVVDNGTAALDALKRDPPDLILADFDLEGMNVAAFASRARIATHTDHQTPIIVLVSPNDSCDTDRLTAMGIQASIRKPLDSEILRQAVKRWIPAPPDATVVFNGNGRLPFLHPADHFTSFPSPPPADHNTSTVPDHNNATEGEKENAPSWVEPPPMRLALPDIPEMISLEPTAISEAPEGVMSHAPRPVVDLSAAFEWANASLLDLALLSGPSEAKTEAVAGAENLSGIVAAEAGSPVDPEAVDLSPVFSSIVTPALDGAVDATPKIDLEHERETRPETTPLVLCESPPASPPPMPEISVADLRAAIEAEVAARLPEIVRAILTPEMAQTTLAKVAHDVVPLIAEAEIIKEIQRLESKIV